MVTKKLPGKNTEEMVYDLNDRLVAWRDALLTAQGKWQYTKYDVLDRLVMTGLVSHSISAADLQTLVNGLGTNNAVINSTSGKSGTTNAGGYPRATDGNGEAEVLTVNYYDNYSFRKSTLTYVKPTGYHDSSTKTHGLLTGKLVKNLSSGTRYETAVYYDGQGRVIQTISDHHLGGTIRISTRYDFENKPLATYTQYSTPGTYNITRGYFYDGAGQLSHITHRIGTGTIVTLAQHSYNDLGQLTGKSFPAAGSAQFSYNYNIRGWLKRINNPQTSNSSTKLFAQELFYETGGAQTSHNNWNGNITRSDWRGRDDLKREYRYLYDRANRITAANYTVPSATTQNNRYNLAGIQYDPNGNITGMQRNNQMTSSTFGMVDNLTYNYDTHGNRLLQVADAVSNNTHLAKDFKERSTSNYTYDNNGNLKSNLDKEISTINYNHLNLPTEIILSGTNRKITYQYDAEGNKVREVSQNGASTVTRDYIGEFVFVNNAIDHMIHEEGRVAYESGTPRYEFFVKDHLGNVRQVIRAAEGSSIMMATMEPENEEKEKTYFENITESRQGAMEHNVTEGGYAVAWLNADRGRILGPARSQEVQEGDTIKLSVFGKYMDPKKFRLFPTSFLKTGDLSAVASQLNELGQQYAGSGPNQILLANAIMLVLTDLQQKPAPEAYMAYALYDRDSNQYDSGKILLSKKARNKHEELKKDIFVEKDGYIEAFVVNETSENVWYDNFSIQSTGPIVVQETHYDPWGVELQGLGYQEPGIKVNKYLYNGKEFNDHLGVNLFDYRARMYDASIGRWFVVDPMANHGLQIDKSPYAYGWNNPIKYNDPSGLCPNGCSENEQSGEPYKDGAIVENKYGKSEYKDGEWIVISNTPDGSGTNTSTKGGSGSGGSSSESSGNGFLGSSGWGDMSPKYSDNPVVQRMRENSASIRRNVIPFAKHMTRSTIDGVGYVGTGISTIGTVATPFVPHIGFGLLAVGGVVSTASSLTSAGMNVMEGNVRAASFDVAMAGFGNAGPVGFKALKNSKYINTTDQVVLGSVYSFSMNILDVFRSKK